MVLKSDWLDGDDYTADAANAVATQVNTNTTDIAGKADTSAIPDALTDLDTTVTGTQLNDIKTKVDGITASSAEVNILDGATLSTTELNYVDGVTSAVQTQLNAKPDDLADLGVTASAAELNALDGITASTAELNILDGVTSTASELNALDGITSTVTELNYTDGVTSAIQTQLNGKYGSGGTDVAVADGGTGRSTSTTAYGLIAAGTTATGAHQTLAAGAATAILVGGGASALPVWTTATGSGAPVRATSPALVTPTGIVKGDVGLGNVDNVSNATERAATKTLSSTRITKRVSAVTSSATPAVNSDNCDAFNIAALTHAVTGLSFSGTPTDWQPLGARITASGGARAFVAGSSCNTGFVTVPASIPSGKTLCLAMFYNSATSKWDVLGAVLET